MGAHTDTHICSHSHLLTLTHTTRQAPELYPCHGQGGSQSFLLTSDGVLMLTASQFTLALCPSSAGAGSATNSVGLAFQDETTCRARGRVVFAGRGDEGTLKWVPSISIGAGGGCIAKASAGTGIAVRSCSTVGLGRWELRNADRVE